MWISIPSKAYQIYILEIEIGMTFLLFLRIDTDQKWQKYFSIIKNCVIYIFRRYWFRPFGLYLGLRDTKHHRAPTNDILEEKFEDHGYKARIEHAEVRALSAQLGMTERAVERWFRKRKLQDKPNTLDKFAETG